MVSELIILNMVSEFIILNMVSGQEKRKNIRAKSYQSGRRGRTIKAREEEELSELQSKRRGRTIKAREEEELSKLLILNMV